MKFSSDTFPDYRLEEENAIIGNEAWVIMNQILLYALIGNELLSVYKR